MSIPDDAPLTALAGIGPAVSSQLEAADIKSVGELRTIGAHDAYGKMMKNGLRPHFIGYYALAMAVQGRPWSDCKGAEKEALRIRFDALKTDTSVTGDTAIERELRAIGIMI